MRNSSIPHTGLLAALVCLLCASTNVVSQHRALEERALEEEDKGGKGNLRIVHHALLANMVRGRFSSSAEGFTFHPVRPVWLMDSLHVPAARIDTVTTGMGSIHIHLKGQSEEAVQLQCRDPGKQAAVLQGLLAHNTIPSFNTEPGEHDGAGYDVVVSGATFGSTIHTPVCFTARMKLQGQEMVLKSSEVPFSCMHTRYRKEQIKRIAYKQDRIKVILHEGGRFSVRTGGNMAAQEAIGLWYGQQ